MPQTAGNAPGRGGSQGQGCGDEEHLDNAVDTGVGVPIDDVPHSVGKQQSRHQKHQSADGDGIRVLGDAHALQSIGQQCHEEGGGNGSEELVGLQLIQIPIHQADQQAAQTGAQTVPPGTAHKQAKAAGSQEIPQILGFHGIFPAAFPGGGEHFASLGQGRPLGHQGTAQSTEFFHPVHVVAVVADPAHPGQGGALIGANGDHNIVGDGKNIGIHAVGGQDPGDAFLHPEGLRTAHGQLVPQVDGQIHQKIVVHGVHLCFLVGMVVV